MDPLREQILAAFTAKLGAITGITNLRIDRNRTAGAENYPSLLVYEGDENLTYDTAALAKIAMNVTVIGLCQAANDPVIGLALNTLYAKTMQAAMSDTSLGGLCIDVRLTNAAFDIEDESARPQGSFRAEFIIDYWLNPADPFSLPLT